MKIPIYYIPNNIDDLRVEEYKNTIQIAKLRENTKILIIDDDDFPLLQPLSAAGYNLTKKNGNEDIKTLDDVYVYDIILCDIKGVGKHFGGTLEGAHLAEQIKIKFPNKIIISYSASMYEITYQKHLEKLDGSYSKGLGVEDWSAILDEHIKNLADPIAQWKKTRTILLDNQLPLIEIAKIESYYVKAVKRNEFADFKSLICKNNKINEFLRDILSHLIVNITINII